MENLLYADSKNCALLKETVMDYLVENDIEAAKEQAESWIRSLVFWWSVAGFGPTVDGIQLAPYCSKLWASSVGGCMLRCWLPNTTQAGLIEQSSGRSRSIEVVTRPGETGRLANMCVWWVLGSRREPVTRIWFYCEILAFVIIICSWGQFKRHPSFVSCLCVESDWLVIILLEPGPIQDKTLTNSYDLKWALLQLLQTLPSALFATIVLYKPTTLTLEFLLLKTSLTT